MHFIKLLVVLIIVSNLVYGSLEENTLSSLAQTDDRCTPLGITNHGPLAWTQDSSALIMFSYEENTFFRFDIATETVTQVDDLLNVGPLPWQSSMLAASNEIDIIWNQEGTIAAQWNENAKVSIHFMENDQDTVTLPENTSYISLNADGSYLATTLNDGTIMIWETTSLNPVLTVKDHASLRFSWNPNNPNEYAAISSTPNTRNKDRVGNMVNIWDINEEEPKQTLHIPEQNASDLIIDHILWSNDGTHILGLLYGISFYLVWNVTTGEFVLGDNPPIAIDSQSQWHEIGIVGLNYSFQDDSDGEYKRAVVIWDVLTSTEIDIFSEYAYGGQLSPDGNYLIVNNGEGLLSICQIRDTGE